MFFLLVPMEGSGLHCFPLDFCSWIRVVFICCCGDAALGFQYAIALVSCMCDVSRTIQRHMISKKKKKKQRGSNRLRHFYSPHFSKITAFGKNFPNQNTNPSRSLPHIPTMPDDRQSTPPLVPLPVAEYVLPALANTVTSVLELLSLHPLSQFLGTANTHDFATTEIDTIALLLAISRQNEHLHGLLDTLHQKVHAIGLQNDTLTQKLAARSTQVQGVAPATTEAHLTAITSHIQLHGDNFSSFATENNAALSHVRSSVSALEQRVGMAQTPNPANPAQPQNAKPAQPPARRQATNNPASGPSNQGQPRPSFAAVAARNSTAPVGNATPKKPQPLPTAQR